MAVGPKVAAGAGVGAVESGGRCGYRISRKAVAGIRLAGDEFAATTYTGAAKGGPGVLLGVVAPPAVAYWGPGERIPPTLPLIGNVGNYRFAGGVVFKNC
jgi:hypothetical protein